MDGITWFVLIVAKCNVNDYKTAGAVKTGEGINSSKM